MGVTWRLLRNAVEVSVDDYVHLLQLGGGLFLSARQTLHSPTALGGDTALRPGVRGRRPCGPSATWHQRPLAYVRRILSARRRLSGLAAHTEVRLQAPPLHEDRQLRRATELLPMVAWAMYNRALRAAAAAVRRHLLDEPHAGDAPELITLTSMARAVARRDRRLAAALRIVSPTARRHLRVEASNVSLAHSTEFSEHLRIAKANYFEDLASSAASQKEKGSGGRLAPPLACRRCGLLWLDASLCVRSTSTTPTAGATSSLVARALRRRCASKACLQRWGRCIDVSGFAAPTVELYTEVILRARHSAPGPDGIPAATWQANPEISAQIALCFDDEVRAGHTLPLWANITLQVFLPTGSTDGDDVSVSRTALAVRPRGIKNVGMRFFAAG